MLQKIHYMRCFMSVSDDKVKEECLKIVTLVTFWLTSANSYWKRFLYILTMFFARPLQTRVSESVPHNFTEDSSQLEYKRMLTGIFLSLTYKKPDHTFCIGTDCWHEHLGIWSRTLIIWTGATLLKSMLPYQQWIWL